MTTNLNKENRVLNIKGSSRVVSDYFEICIHNILFQRHIYPKEDFKVIRKFGLNLVYSKNEEVITYIKRIIKQLHRWIYLGKINLLTMAIVDLETNQIAEKWMFHIDVMNNEQALADLDEDLNIANKKSIEQIQVEIQSIIRQISSSVTFLPEFEDPHTFKILVHTTGDDDFQIPKDWGDMEMLHDIQGNEVESVKFNNFKTDNHKISTFVTYKTRDQ